MTPIQIVCAACGDARGIEVDGAPRFGVDVATYADAVGFQYVFDLNYGRVVIFCSDQCKDANVTKRGTLRRNIVEPKEPRP